MAMAVYCRIVYPCIGHYTAVITRAADTKTVLIRRYYT